MSPLLLGAVLLGGVLVSAIGVAASIRIAVRVGAYDHPDSQRKTQEHPIPRLGGVAVAVAFAFVALVSLAIAGPPRSVGLAAALLAPALLMAILGFVDDVRHVQPGLRLSVQAAVALLAWILGTRISFTEIWWVDLLFFLVWVLAIVNGINLLDNSDGLAATTVLVAALGATAIAFSSGQELVAVLGVALAGVAIGFLWFNWSPARVYLGDSGAYFLGFLVAVLTVRLRPESLDPEWSFLVPILLLALPIADTTFVVFKRATAGVHPFTAGRDHLSHKLQGFGLSTGWSVMVLQFVSVLGACAAFLVYTAG